MESGSTNHRVRAANFVLGFGVFMACFSLAWLVIIGADAGGLVNFEWEGFKGKNFPYPLIVLLFSYVLIIKALKLIPPSSPSTSNNNNRIASSVAPVGTHYIQSRSDLVVVPTQDFDIVSTGLQDENFERFAADKLGHRMVTELRTDTVRELYSVGYLVAVQPNGILVVIPLESITRHLHHPPRPGP